jgi:purine-nucleoside phosphorylase
MLKKIKETVSYLKNRIDFKPGAGRVLGTGFGGLINEIDIKYERGYHTIPNFNVLTLEGHNRKLFFGFLI